MSNKKGTAQPHNSTREPKLAASSSAVDAYISYYNIHTVYGQLTVGGRQLLSDFLDLAGRLFSASLCFHQAPDTCTLLTILVTCRRRTKRNASSFAITIWGGHLSPFSATAFG